MGAPFPPETYHLFIQPYGEDPAPLAGAQTYVDTLDKIYGKIVTVTHSMTGVTTGGYVVVEFSGDNENWFVAQAPTDSTISGGGAPSGNQTVNYYLTFAPVAFAYVRVTLHATDGVHVCTMLVQD